MRLRTKLVGTSLGAVVLVTLLGGVSWYGMKYMGLRADQAVSLDSATMDLLLAKISQLRFLYYGDQQEITLTRQYAEASEKTYAQASQNAPNSSAATLRDNLGEYVQRFNTIVQQNDALSSTSKNLLELTANMDKSFFEAISSIESAQIQAPTASGFSLFAALAESRARLNLSRVAMLAYLSSPSANNATKAQSAIADAQSRLREVSTLLDTASNFSTVALRDSLAAIQDQFTQYRAQFDAALAERDKLQGSIINIHQLVLDTAELARATTDQAVANLNTAHDQVVGGIAGLTLLVLGLSILVSFLLTRSVLVQLGKDPGELADAARKVSNGDFSIADASGQGVFADLIRMVRSLRDNIDKARQESDHAKAESGQAMLARAEAEKARLEAIKAKHEGMMDAAQRLEKVAGVVSAASARLANQIDEAEHGAHEQAERITETATAMEEMNITMTEVAHNAASASETATDMRAHAMDGSRIMENAVAGMGAVYNHSSGVKRSMEELTGHVQSINIIMNVISDIADQTNLLALNAAIEAARAGDAGRGFAVVADEVRKLAEKTLASTSDVASVIKGINQSAADNMRQVDDTVREISNTTELVNQSGIMIDSIGGLVENTAGQVRQIATASEQQSAASEEITRSMAKVNSIALNMAAVMGESSQTVIELAAQAHELANLIEALKKE